MSRMTASEYLNHKQRVGFIFIGKGDALLVLIGFGTATKTIYEGGNPLDVASGFFAMTDEVNNASLQLLAATENILINAPRDREEVYSSDYKGKGIFDQTFYKIPGVKESKTFFKFYSIFNFFTTGFSGRTIRDIEEHYRYYDTLNDFNIVELVRHVRGLINPINNINEILSKPKIINTPLLPEIYETQNNIDKNYKK